MSNHMPAIFVRQKIMVNYKKQTIDVRKKGCTHFFISGGKFPPNQASEISMKALI